MFWICTIISYKFTSKYLYSLSTVGWEHPNRILDKVKGNKLKLTSNTLGKPKLLNASMYT